MSAPAMLAPSETAATPAPVRQFGEVLLSAENITLNFGGVRALNAISLDIRKGEIRAIIGPNGAGKTSMLNVINGFYHPQSGLHHLQGPEAPLACARIRPRPQGHRAHLPECGAVQGHEHARQSHGRAGC